MPKTCEICKSESNEFKEICDIEVCDKCYSSIISVMQYKNHKDMVEEEKNLLQKFLNKLSKKLLDK